MTNTSLRYYYFFILVLTCSPSRATCVMYMRRCGIPFETIAKVTGHQNLESLIKHYDLQLEVGAPLARQEFLLNVLGFKVILYLESLKVTS